MSKSHPTGPNQGSGGENVANLTYFGQLAAANHVKKLVERYLSLAPVFIGGPANTSLENPPPAPPPRQPPPPHPAHPGPPHCLNDSDKGLQNNNIQVRQPKHK